MRCKLPCFRHRHFRCEQNTRHAGRSARTCALPPNRQTRNWRVRSTTVQTAVSRGSRRFIAQVSSLFYWSSLPAGIYHDSGGGYEVACSPEPAVSHRHDLDAAIFRKSPKMGPLVRLHRVRTLCMMTTTANVFDGSKRVFGGLREEQHRRFSQLGSSASST